MTVAVAYLRPDFCAPEFLECLADAQIKDRDRKHRLLGATLGRVSGPRIADSRNKVSIEFLDKTDSEWLLWIDSDMTFTLEDIDKLVASAHKTSRPVVGGLYIGRLGPKLQPHMYRLVPEENPVQVIEDYPEDTLVEVDATGAGFLLIHRGVLNLLRKTYGDTFPFFVESTSYKNVAFGEDWAFLMRVKQAKIPLYVHTGVTLGHVKKVILTEAMYRAMRDQEREKELVG